MLATQSQLIPSSELNLGEVGRIRNDLIKRMVTMATQETRLTEERLIVRDIRAKYDLVIYSAGADADIEDWAGVTGSTRDAYETMATGTMDDQRWCGFYGVKADGGAFSCTAIRFNVGGADKVIWQLQGLNEEDGYVGYCPTGIVIPQNQPYTISRFVRETSSPVMLVLKGVIVEPRGKVVSP